MTDTLSKDKRHINMSHIKSAETKIEIKVRKWLYKNGVRYRKNSRNILGTPDISIKKYKIAIFINGCFWHGHYNCKLATVPKTNTDFWVDKIKKNKVRDIKIKRELESEGWHVLVIWECQLGKEFENTMTTLLDKINEIKTKNIKSNR